MSVIEQVNELPVYFIIASKHQPRVSLKKTDTEKQNNEVNIFHNEIATCYPKQKKKNLVSQDYNLTIKSYFLFTISKHI